MKKNISFLIIVPTLNSYRLLPKLVDSLEKQTFNKWRVIFVDGGSTKRHIKKLEQICSNNQRFTWIKQSNEYKFIYGAMNYGMKFATKGEWVLFWGSDDYASSKNSLMQYVNIYNDSEKLYKFTPDLIVLAGRYFNFLNRKKTRTTFFSFSKELLKFNSNNVKKKFFLGFSIPHQSVAFSPRSIRLLDHYDEKFKLAADLKCFLEMVFKYEINLATSNKVIVNIGDSGISHRLRNQRLKEVFSIYKEFYPKIYLLPVVLRYARKIINNIALFNFNKK